MLASLLIVVALAEPVHAVFVQRSQYDGMCGGQDAVRIRLDQHVEAVRVFWARDGERHETTVDAPRGEWITTTILLGRVSCAGENVFADDLRAGVVMGLMAIWPDGSETPVEGLPTLLDLDELPREKPPPPRDPDELVVTHCGPIYPVETLYGPWPREPGPSGAIALVLVGGAIAVGSWRGALGGRAPRMKVKIPRARVIR
jgi:hypothetical protein